MRVGADERVGEVPTLVVQYAEREGLEVDLVHDADAGRHDLEPVEGLHAPLEELVARAVALELDPHVQLDGVGAAGEVDLPPVVGGQIAGHGDLRRGGGSSPNGASLPQRIAPRRSRTPGKSERQLAVDRTEGAPNRTL